MPKEPPHAQALREACWMFANPEYKLIESAHEILDNAANEPVFRFRAAESTLSHESTFRVMEKAFYCDPNAGYRGLWTWTTIISPDQAYQIRIDIDIVLYKYPERLESDQRD